jgi:hypothetical protein
MHVKLYEAREDSMLNETALSNQFARMGARFQVNPSPTRRGWALDVVRDEEGPAFELRAEEKALAELEAVVANVDRASRHLLLFVRAREGARPHRYLCGHDERDWFLATIPGKASTVAQAMEALKPKPVIEAQASAGLKRKQLHRRHNPAFLRQGEWFFVNVTEGERKAIQEAIKKNKASIGHKIAIRRDMRGRIAGKPHVADELIRLPGNPLGHGFAVNSVEIFVRGKVRHADHETVAFKEWRKVIRNAETGGGNGRWID